MRTIRTAAIATAVIFGAAACSGDDPNAPGTPGGPKVKEKIALGILKVDPSQIYIEGGTVTLALENGCPADQLSAEVEGREVTNIFEVEANIYSIELPPFGSLTQKDTKLLTVTCQAPYDTENTEYSSNTASTSIEYDPDSAPQPTTETFLPSGDKVSVLAQMRVTFTRKMNKDTINSTTFYIEGPGNPQGDVTYDESTGVATFKPRSQLQYGATYTCVIKGGQDGVRSIEGKSLLVRLGDNPSQDRWTFTTRKEGEGNPWVGDISAAAGISTGGNYKLFSVTGQPTPVGEASSDEYKVQAGFIYATQPAQQNE